MERISLLQLALPLALVSIAACSSDTKNDAGSTPPDSGVPPDSGEPPDVGGFPDAEPAETGPLPCLWDQGGANARGCDPGEVCNLAMEPHVCVPGKGCNSDSDCNSCSTVPGPAEDCGHGYHVVAFCDDRHAPPTGGFAGTCTRSRAPCEKCDEDKDCGHVHPLLGGAPNKCLQYSDGNYCGRPCGSCPDGFVCDAQSSQCRRDQCDPIPVFCPPDNMIPPDCAGTDQICPGEECPETGGAKCSTNNQPGALGICIGFCDSDDDCPEGTPICNPRNGICIAGCTKGSCASGLACHSDGFCHAPCADNAFCETTYGTDTYCNMTNQDVEPRFYKAYHDINSCQKLGCEDRVDCEASGVVCDKAQIPPACTKGCYDSMDCMSGELCKSTGGNPPLDHYSREQCRALPTKNDATEIGVCCSPGCVDRNNQCGINEFCCAEPDSPYEDPASCLALTSTGGPQAQPGQCFDMPVTEPWCHMCTGGAGECASGYQPGYNVDVNINGGNPFQEQEFCVPVAQGVGLCGVTCNPSLPDNQCPRGWICRAVTPDCDQDADCNGLECVDAVPDDPATMNVDEHRFGRCKCGEEGAQISVCPTAYAVGSGAGGAAIISEAVTYPRCVDINNQGQDLYCVSNYQCMPPAARPGLYPPPCGL